jgi:Protein of unknown function (DUF3152)
MSRLHLLAFVVVLGACGNGVVVAPEDAVAPSSTLAGSTTSAAVITVPPTTVSPTTVPPTTVPPTTVPPTAEVPSTTLVDAASLPRRGTGEFREATDVAFEIEGSPMIEFTIAVEDGAGVDIGELADFVTATLTDDRSWSGRGAGFRLVDDGGLFTLVVATPDTVDGLCRPLRTVGRFSCARNGWIALNLVRWETATDDWPADLDTYRRYLVNHEIGHYIVGPAHASCPAPEQPAPVMMQQTKGLDGCVANGWVDP